MESIQTFPGPTLELENTLLISLTAPYPFSNLELWILPSLVAMNSLILIVIGRQYKLLKINKSWQLDVLVIFSLSCFNIL